MGTLWHANRYLVCWFLIHCSLTIEYVSIGHEERLFTAYHGVLVANSH